MPLNPYADVIDWLDTEDGLEWLTENHHLIIHAHTFALMEGSEDEYETAFRFASVKEDGKLCAVINNPEHFGCTESAMIWTAGSVFENFDGFIIKIPAVEGEMPSCP